MDKRERNRKYVKKSRMRRSKEQIYRDSNRYKTSLNNYITRLLGTSKYEDKIKNRNFNIDREYILKLYDEQFGKCAMSNVPLRHDGSLFSVSIDRLDNVFGHVVGNVQLVCLGMNLARNNGSCDDARLFVRCLLNPDLFVPESLVSRDFVSSLRRNVVMCEVSDLTTDFLLGLFEQSGRCCLSGIRMCGYRHPVFSLSIDRLDNGFGHVVGNVRLVCRAVNRARKDRSDVEFFEFLDVVRFYGS